jgi:hypothetical protein
MHNILPLWHYRDLSICFCFCFCLLKMVVSGHSLILLVEFKFLLAQCPCVATGSYNSSITYIYKCVLYCYEMEDDIHEPSGMTLKRNSSL